MRIEWETTTYTTSEDSGTVQLVLLKEGTTVRNVTVEVMAMDSSAVGEAHQTSSM